MDEAAPVPAPAAQSPLRRRRRKLAIALAAVAATLALLAALTGSLFWAVLTPGGTAWLLANLARAGIGISTTEPQGSLVGDFSARQVVVDLGGTRIVIDEPAWQALGISYARLPGAWATLDIASLKARRITLTLPAPSGKPLTLPAHLRLPFTLHIHRLEVDEVLLPGLTQPLRRLQAEVQLGAERGALHRVDGLVVQLDPLLIQGNGRIATGGAMALELDLRAAQNPQLAGPALPAWARTLRTDWRAQLTAKGPLARFELQALLRAHGQQLDGNAQVALLERWPLPQLDLRTQSLDLSALLNAAPLTSLTGQLTIAATRATPDAAVSELVAKGDFRNAQPGRWDQQRVPLRGLQLELQAHTDRVTALNLRRFDAQLAGLRDAGSLQGQGHWDADGFALSAQLVQLQPSALDARLPAVTLSGPITLSGQTPRGPDGQPSRPSFTAQAELNGRVIDLAQTVQVKLAAQGDAGHIELQEFRATAGKAQATLAGRADHEGSAWRVKATAGLVDFDPRPWFPGPTGSAWQNGPHRLNLKGNADLSVPEPVEGDKKTALQRAAQIVGMVTAQFGDSVVAGVPVSGEASLSHAAANDTLRFTALLDAADNHLKAEFALAPDLSGNRDRGSFEVDAPQLARVAPLLQLVPAIQASGMAQGLSGQGQAQGQFRGRWPVVSTEGEAQVVALRAGPLAGEQARLRWKFGSTLDAPVDVSLDIDQAVWGGQQAGATALQLKGTPGLHELHFHSELRAAPPAWMEALQARAATADTPLSRTRIQLDAKGGLEGGFLDGPRSSTPLGWKGTLAQLDVRSGESGATPLLVTRGIGIEVSGQPLQHLAISAGRADILGAGLRWDRIEWQPGEGLRAQQLDMQAELEPIAIAPLLRRMQPTFGWGGDLTIGGKVVIRQADRFTADIVIERKGGDLHVTDEAGTQAMGLTDIRLALEAKDGEWNFTQGLAGTSLGTFAGALVVHTSPMRAWPEATAAVEGVLVAQVENLNTWGGWVPTGWRLGGNLRASASIGGRFNGIEYTGDLKGNDISVRNLLQGVNVTQGEVDISLRGDTAKINTLRARGGNGTVSMEGDARLGEVPQARLAVVADKFQLLSRIDRRIVTSGKAALLIDKEKLDVDGRFQIDEALIDFTRSNAPSLASDVTVTGRSGAEEELPRPASGAARAVNVNLQVNLGEELRLRGRGLDTRLRGELKLTTPGGKPALNGTVSAADGTYAAYGQKLQIDRGEVVFSGAVDNPRVDIEATRPNLDVRVGVMITGPLMSLRVRLFSEPEMSNTDKLSWLMLGRASDGLGRTDTALLQRAAMALLAGEGEGVTDQITKALGLDEISVSQATTAADTRETLVSFGKQLSRRVFLTYEQNLNTSAGSVQLTYRIAQRFLARVQGGINDRSVDFIWGWRWE